MTRRTFAKVIAASATGHSVHAAHKLRLGIGTYTYHNLSVDEMILQLKRLNITEIEMSRAEFMNFTHPPASRFEDFRQEGRRFRYSMCVVLRSDHQTEE